MNPEAMTGQKRSQLTSEVLWDTDEVALLKRAIGFLSRFHVLIKLAQTHERHNQAVQDATEALYSVFIELLSEVNQARFDLVNGSIYFNAARLAAGATGYDILEYMVKQMRSRNLGSIIFDETAEPEDLVSFAFVFARTGKDGAAPYDEILRLMALEGIAGIKISRMVSDETNELEGEIPCQPKEQARKSFISAMHLVKEAVKDGIVQGRINPRKIKRVIESIVDSILSDEHSMLALTAIRNYDEYTYHHSLNVCIYSVALANRLSLPRKILAEIGTAALFHDIGKTDIPQGILNKTGNLSEEERKILQKHTIAGVKQLTHLKKIDSTTLRSMIVAFSHHLNIDSTGYPETKRKIKPDAISRIVRIADVFDALTSARIYRTQAFSKAEALAMISERAGDELDATLCALLAEVVGIELPKPAKRTS